MSENLFCQKCGCELKRHDGVDRIVRRKGNIIEHVKVDRYQCPKCRSIHRITPECLYPHKQYEAEIIDGVREGLIDSSTYGFEDYPSEITMKRWREKSND